MLLQHDNKFGHWPSTWVFQRVWIKQPVIKKVLSVPSLFLILQIYDLPFHYLETGLALIFKLLQCKSISSVVILELKSTSKISILFCLSSKYTAIDFRKAGISSICLFFPISEEILKEFLAETHHTMIQKIKKQVSLVVSWHISIRFYFLTRKLFLINFNNFLFKKLIRIFNSHIWESE